MAKLRGAAKVAFLRRMARGRARARRGSGVRRARTTGKRRVARRAARGYSGTIYRSRKHAGVVRFRVRRNPLQALIANPSRRRVRRRRNSSTALVPYGYTFPARKRRRKKGASTMAKRRKRRSGRRRVRRASPRRRTYRRRPVHRRRRARRAYGRRGGVARVRRGTRVIYINPRHRRRGVRRRRNPGMGGVIRMALIPYATGVATSAAMAMLDSGLAASPMIGNLVKAGGAVAIAAFFGRRHPMAASAAIGAIGASQGYPLVTKLAGGMFAHTPAQAVKGLGEMSDTYPEMGALLQGGLGALLQGPTDVPMTSTNYQTALQNMADDDDDS